jgi:hypothetical protein
VISHRVPLLSLAPAMYVGEILGSTVAGGSLAVAAPAEPRRCHKCQLRGHADRRGRGKTFVGELLCTPQR